MSNRSHITDYTLPPEGRAYKENVADTRESPVREMAKELKEFGVDVYGYDPLISKEEIEAFRIKALPKELYSFLAQVLSRRKKVFCKKKKCVDVRGMFDEEDPKNKGFYYKRL